MSMVSRRLTQQLNLKRYPCDIKFVGAMESIVGSSSHSVSLTLKPSSFSMPVTDSVLGRVSMDLPLQEVTNVKNYPYLQVSFQIQLQLTQSLDGQLLECAAPSPISQSLLVPLFLISQLLPATVNTEVLRYRKSSINPVPIHQRNR